MKNIWLLGLEGVRDEGQRQRYNCGLQSNLHYNYKREYARAML